MILIFPDGSLSRLDAAVSFVWALCFFARKKVCYEEIHKCEGRNKDP